MSVGQISLPAGIDYYYDSHPTAQDLAGRWVCQTNLIFYYINFLSIILMPKVGSSLVT